MVNFFGFIIPNNASGYIAHSPIYIDGNADFTPANGVTGGSGTQSDPYIIEGWDINASTDNGIEIRYTNAYFIIRNCCVYDGKNNHNDGIIFYNVKNGLVENTVLSKNDYGFYLYSSSYNNIYNNIALNNRFGIRPKYSSYNNIYNNTINSNSEYGINLYSSSYNNIYNNNVSNNGNGIRLTDSPYNNIYNNTINSNSEYGIHIRDSTYSTLVNNTLENNGIFINAYKIKYFNTQNIDTTNTANGKPIYYYKNQKDIDIDGWSVGQVILFNCTNFTIKNVDCSSASVGVEFAYCNHCSIENSSFNNEQYGIYIWSSDNNIIKENFITLNDQGIRLVFSDNNVIINNMISNNGVGIWPDASHSNTIGNNTIVLNKNGILLYFNSNWNIISDNTILNATFAYYESHSHNNIIINNRILNNKLGIYLFVCWCDKIFHNSFIGNVVQAIDEPVWWWGLYNQWDDGYPSGGNYWSDYTGSDDNKDGIGDIPYNITNHIPIPIPCTIQDRYPLMLPWLPIEISVEKK